MTSDNHKKENKRSFFDYFIWVCKNGVAALICWFLISHFVFKQPGYQWITQGMLKQNMELIKQYPKLTTDQKYEMKLGTSYAYLKFIREQTPPNAIILYPERDDFFPPGAESRFKGQEPYNKVWATRFLFPRKLVTPSELKDSPYTGQITHVAIVNGRGRDRLSYPVPEEYQFSVLPVNLPTQNQN